MITRRNLLPLLLIAATCVVMAPVARADQAASATGHWRWSYAGPNGEAVEVNLTLDQDGEKLTGALIGRLGRSEIQDGTVKDGKVTFKVSHKGASGDPEVVVEFQGKVSSDTISGSATVTSGSQTRRHDWQATRVAATK